MKRKKQSVSKKKKQKVKFGNIFLMLFIIAAIGGTYGGIKYYQSSKCVKVATVDSASNSMEVSFSEMAKMSYFGKPVKGSVVNVKHNPNMTIKKVNVKKGDTVKKGDVLISYETHELEDAVADAELEITTLTNDMTILNNEIDILTRIQPSENQPREVVEEEEPETDASTDTDSDTEFDIDASPDEPEYIYEKKITERSVPVGGTGKADDPLMYRAGEYTIVSKELLAAFASEKKPVYAVFYVYDETGTQLYIRVIDGSMIDKEKLADFHVNDGVTVTPSGMVSYSGKSADYASFMTAIAPASSPEDIDTDLLDGFGLPEGFEFPEDFEMPEPQPEPAPVQTDTDIKAYELSLNDNYMYSLQELKDMIAERQKQLAKLDLQKRQAELNAKNARRMAQTGGETAVIDGVVTFVAKDTNHLPDSGAYITIANSAGMSISSSVGEFSRDKVQIGMKAVVKEFESGATAEGTVTALSDVPVEQGSYEDMMNDSLESQYRFTVSLDRDMDIGEDTQVDISLVTEESENAIKLPLPLVRAEASRYYVMVCDANGLLEKRYVTAGEISDGIIEIIDGLESTDLIAFPYGKAVVGAKTKTTGFMEMYYNFSLF